jgi:hypothetical protein
LNRNLPDVAGKSMTPTVKRFFKGFGFERPEKR